MNENGHISNITAILMIFVAACFDLVQFLLDFLHLIPVIGNFFAATITALISLVAWLSFFIWFKRHGVNFQSTKKAMAMGGGFVIELIPVLNALPAWTLAVVIICLTSRAPQVVQMAAGASRPSSVSSIKAPIPNKAS